MTLSAVHRRPQQEAGEICGLGRSRWAADVKGKPVKPVRSSLNIACTTSSGEGMNYPEMAVYRVVL